MEEEEGDGEDGEEGEQDVDDVDGEAGRLQPALAQLGGVHAGQVVCRAPGPRGQAHSCCLQEEQLQRVPYID